MLHKKGKIQKPKIMKKRFTIMLNQSTIKALKKLAALRDPRDNREELERVLWEYACEELSYYGDQ